METYTLDEVQDKLIKEPRAPEQKLFECEFQIDLMGKVIKRARQERNLTQKELAKLIGVHKTQISRIENNPNNVTIKLLLRVFSALKSKVKLQVELPNLNISLRQR
jgi:DNA-binding XRE family transcriptional regulator